MSKTLTVRSLTFFDDGESAKFSVATIEEGHICLKVTPGQCALANTELSTYVADQLSKATRQKPIE